MKWVVGVLLIFSGCFADDHEGKAIKLKSDTFKNALTQSDHFVMFFAPWCGHCKRLAPTWQDLAGHHNDKENDVVIAQVDCTVETALCSENDVTGYPTLKYFKAGSDAVERYRGNRDLASLEAFIGAQKGKTNEEPVEEAAAKGTETPQAKEKVAVLELKAEGFSTKTAHGMFFIKFFAPWCGHCQNLAPAWEQLGQALEHDETVTVAKVDCTQHRSVCEENGIKGYPTLLWFKDGKMVEKYQGSRSLDSLKDYVTKMAEKPVEVSDEGRIPEPAADVVVELVGGNFENGIASGVTFVKFFAPWCGHCKKMASTWEDLAKKYVGSSDVKVAKVDCTKDESRKLCSAQEVSGYPTVFLYRDGKKVAEYEGSRTLDDLTSFVAKHSTSRDEL